MDPKELEFPQEKEGWGPKARPKGSLSSQKKKILHVDNFLDSRNQDQLLWNSNHTYCIPLSTLNCYVDCVGVLRVSGDAFLMRAARS